VDGYVLGLDGGGTGTQCLATGLAGEELFRLEGGSININGSTAQA